MVNDFPFSSLDRALMVCPNHISWWDEIFAGWMCVLGSRRRVYVATESNRLKFIRLFNKIDMFAVNHGSPNGTASWMQVFLQDPENLLVFFPQEQLQPFGEEPLRLDLGLTFLSRDYDRAFDVLPLAFKIQYEEQARPAVYARFAEPLDQKKIRQDSTVFTAAFHDNIRMLDMAALGRQYAGMLL